MPDFDPKSIPILDDIIVEDNSDSEPPVPDIADDERHQDDSHIDLFAEQASDIDSSEMSGISISTMEVVVETLEPEVTGAEIADPEITDIDRFIETTASGSGDLVTGSIDFETGESALIDYRTEELTKDIGETENDRQHENSQHEKAALAEAVSPLSLEAIAEDVVKQLVPDLEQQLRLLVMQALEEKLPDEIMARLSPDNDD